MSKQKTKDDKYKENFIHYLSSLTPQEINKLIQEKGKEPKLVSPIIYYNNNGGNKNE